MRADVGKFRRDVYAVVGEIPRGRVLTYGQVARIVGWPNHARLVGRVLHGAAEWSGVPCHRVVNSAGRTAPHWPEQVELLRAEGVVFRSNGCVDMEKCGWKVGV